MPIDPNSGLYSQQDDKFPGGIFGNALQINNNQIGQNLADEAAQKRALQSHLMELQGQGEEQSITERTRLAQQKADADAKATGFENYVSANPGASTDDLFRHALAAGVKDTSTLSNMSYHEGMVQGKDDKLSKDYIGEARKFIKDKFDAGMNGEDIAGEGALLFPEDAVPQAFWDKVKAYKQSPMAAATIASKAELAAAATTKANKVGAPKASSAQSPQKIDEELRKQDALIANAMLKIKAMPMMAQHSAKKDIVDPLIATRDDYAAKNGRPLRGPKAAATVPAADLTPVSPHPSQTAVVPQATEQPKLKPNWTYKINGKVVTTDEAGNVIQ